MTEIKNICVYCGSSPGDNPVYAAAARALGTALARAGIGLVFGGGSCGLMGVVARAVLAEGGEARGIIPGFLDEREVALTGLTNLEIVPDMHVRKQRMFEAADAFVALPGGIGTLEELAEQLTWIQLGRHAKPLVIADIGGFWRPLLTLFAHMRGGLGAIQGGQATGQPSRQIDFRSAVLPLILAEMQIRYYAQAALLANGRAESDAVTRLLGRAWHDGSYETLVVSLAGLYGKFDPWVHFFGPRGDYISSKDYESQIYSLVEADLRESLRGGSAPVKSAYEVFRHLRDLMRTVIEFKGLTLDSYVDFRDNIKTRVNRIVAGPPAARSKQLLALIDANIVTVTFGPSPSVEPAGTKGFTLGSSHFEQPHCEQVNWLIHGHLENPTVLRSTSSLLTNLWQAGRLRPLCYGETEVGSVALNEAFHPIDAWGRPAQRIWLFGSLTEGVRYFTHYVPSPKSRLRAFLDAQHCVAEIMG